ncbi:MAG: glycerate kinase [Dehalococcoidia bacterium]|nr:glycerate kinase [Dehalococcoidia bacterium]|tara:strand:- start:1217 stop:2350 length:1134 start_codon:yes stop_codon:yes gene_type:complete
MKIIIAPQSFKGSLTANEATECISEAVTDIFPDSELVKLPIADGGDGTLETLVETSKGKIIRSEVLDPLGNLVFAEWGLIEGIAIIEMARSSGLALINPEKLDPMNSTSFGTGQLILEALNSGVKKIILGIGGSATNDCGVGAAKALGIRFFKDDGSEIENNVEDFINIKNINMESINAKINDVDIEVACDVTNTLCGKEGASYIYGPQKGANKEQIEILDNSLLHLSNIIKKDIGKDVLNIKGAGAAGGMGAGMVAFCSATLRPGVDIIFDTLDVEKKIMGADLIITGEGQFDISSTYNKAPTAIAKLGLKHDIPCIGISGSFGEGFEKLDKFGILSKSTLINKISDLETNIKQAKDLLKIAAKEQLKAVKIGMNL